MESTWQPPADDGGSPVTSYLVERRDISRSAWLRVNEVPADTNTCTVPKLVEGNKYLVRVSAINDIDQGPSTEIKEPIIAKCPHGEWLLSLCLAILLYSSLRYMWHLL